MNTKDTAPSDWRTQLEDGLQLAIAAAGNRLRLAEAAGCTWQAVQKWTRIPPDRAHIIAKNLDIPLHDLRPDLWFRVWSKRA